MDVPKLHLADFSERLPECDLKTTARRSVSWTMGCTPRVARSIHSYGIEFAQLYVAKANKKSWAVEQTRRQVASFSANYVRLAIVLHSE